MTMTARAPRIYQSTAPRRRRRPADVFLMLVALASWAVLTLAVLLTVFLTGWIFLAIVLLGSGPAADLHAPPAVVVILALVSLTGGFAWLVARFAASPRTVGLAVVLMFSVFSIAGATWSLANPDWSLFLARNMAWDGSHIWDYQKYPGRVIDNGPSVSTFQQDLSPELVPSIEYSQGGQLKQADFEQFLQSTQTTSFIVIKDDKVVVERYANGFSRDSIVTSFSIAKSFTSALVGIAIQEGYIRSVDDAIVDNLPELRGSGLDRVTIRDLLTMSAGIRYVHEDDVPSLLRPLPFLNDDSKTTTFPNDRSLSLSVSSDGSVPGSVFNYNDYTPQLLGIILERTTRRPVSQYLQEKIWMPLGMEYPASWTLDSNESGFERMMSGINARAIDFARFGQLFLDNGKSNGQQIISESWVTESTSPDPAAANRVWARAIPWKEANGYYTYMWWGLRRPDGSYAYMARGNLQQQWVYVSPRDGVVIARFGLVDNSVDWWPGVFEALTAQLR